MDKRLLQQVFAAAARSKKTVSEFMAEALREKIAADDVAASEERRNLQVEALERVFAMPKWDVTENGRMPTAEERNTRR